VLATAWPATGALCLAAALGAPLVWSRSLVPGVHWWLAAALWIGTGAMVWWSGYTLAVVAARPDLAGTGPVTLTVVTLLVGGALAVLVARLAMSQLRSGDHPQHTAMYGEP
jgi:hypothetical protein